MNAILHGTSLKIEAQPSGQFTGDTFAQSVEDHPQYGRVLRCGTVKFGRKPGTLVVRLDNKPEIAAAVATWQAALAADRATKKAAVDAENAAIESGAQPIEVTYHDGEYLSGYTIQGHAAALLVRLGLAEKVSGWGVQVEGRVIEALGKSFTYPAAAEFARPALEAKAEKEAASEAARQAKFDAARNEAMVSGKPAKLDSHTEACNDPREECDLDIVTRFVNPDGSTYTTRNHTW